MMRTLTATMIGLGMLGTPLSQAAEEGVLAPGATLEKRADGFEFTEGPTCDAEGNLFFTDQPNDRILIWSVDDVLSVFMKPAGRSNGMFFDKKGILWSCADEKNQLWQIAPDKKVTVVVKDYDGKLLDGPNDVWVGPNGDAYFTDPYYERPYWKRGPKEQDTEGVYRLVAATGRLERVVGDLVKPNGIVGTPDGKTLYVADIRGNKTYAYALKPDGALGERRLFCELGSDGMTLDEEGNVYLTGKGVTIFDRSGQQVGHIAVDEPWTANVCFGGKHMHSLFITASKSLYRLRMRVRGATVQ